MNTLDKNTVSPQELENASGGILHNPIHYTYTEKLRASYTKDTGAIHYGCNGKIFLVVTAGKQEYHCTKCSEKHDTFETFVSVTPVPPVLPEN